MFFLMKTKFMRIFSLLLALLMLVGVCSAGVGALDLSKNYEVSWDHTLLDENGSAFTWHTSLSAANNPYGYEIEPRDRYMHDYTVKRLGLAGDKGSWTYDQDFLYAYCIEPGISLPDAKAYQGSTNENQGNKWEAMSTDQRKLIQLALTYPTARADIQAGGGVPRTPHGRQLQSPV